MNTILAAWNEAVVTTATDEMMGVCGAQRWAAKMVGLRPIASVAALSEQADRVWTEMEEADWLEAFAAHPRIGARTKAPHSSAQSAAWSQQEQSATAKAADKVLDQLAEGNARYEEKFGFTYIVCATGKTAEEMLAILNRRLNNDREHELREAAEQQRQIMQIRLGKWLIE